MKRLLVPIDFSESTLAILKVAQNLALKHEAGIYLIHVIEPMDFGSMGMPGGVGVTETMEVQQIYHDQLASYANDLIAAGVGAEGLYREGSVIQAIATEIDNLDIDHVVIGSHKHTPMYDLFLGSTTEGILRLSSRQTPVTVVPMTRPAEDSEFLALKKRSMRFLVPVDFSEGTDVVVQYAIEMAKAMEGEIHLMHVVATMNPAGVAADIPGAHVAVEDEHEADQRRLDAAVRRVREAGITVDAGLAYGAPVDGIVHEAKHRLTDWLIIGSHGHGKLYELLVGSTTDGVIKRVNLPVTVIASRGKAADGS